MMRKVMAMSIVLALALAACGGDGDDVAQAPEEDAGQQATRTDDSDDSDDAEGEQQEQEGTGDDDGPVALSDDLERMVGYGSSEGGAGYNWYVAATSLWNQEFGSQMTAQTGSVSENAVLLSEGQIPTGVTSVLVAREAGEGVYESIHTLWTMFSTPLHVIVRGDIPEIETFDDLRGRVVATGRVGDGTWVAFQGVLEALGWTEDDVRIEPLSKDAAARAFTDGQIDVWISEGPVPTGAFVEAFASRRGARLISLPDEAIEALSEDGTFLPVEIPEGSYEGQESTERTVTIWYYAAVPSTFNEDDAYQLARVLHERYDDFVAAFPGAATATAENTAQFSGFALNPGVERYLQEIGELD